MIDLGTATDWDVLARTICGEARGEGNQGMQAVANVVLNRVAKPGWWGATVKGVCLKPYQFSCWNLGDPNRAVILNLDTDYAIYNDALGIASGVIDGSLPDITGGATSYFAKGTPEPKWAAGKNPCAVIGNHIFFNDID
ncbi:cell wall hydrolase [Fimbriiglobus ruber]|uniref:Cell wall hydrolyses involved in spore germination n=1 Tax=Fimbriiglobus ruber TaxID=1908690 RepID=A0A225DLD1_9BACT|nr:cell wall hydrolase [Fimbriiglobus ruber]OWK42211.1 Cell wall hydrolyses involved in spore germination [Fimbriiglobus ruber]